MSSKKSLLRFPITELPAIPWHFSCETQLLAANYCNLHLPWSSPLPVSVTLHIFQQLAYFGCFSIFSASRLFTIGTLPRVYFWWISGICLNYLFFLRNNSLEYFKLSEKIECRPKAGGERSNKSIFISWLGPLELGSQGKGKVRPTNPSSL